MTEIKDVVATGTRFLVETPLPATTFTLGKPEEKFGYPGISMKSGNDMFVDVGGGSLFQNGGSIAHFTSASYSLFAKLGFSLSSDFGATIATKRTCVVAAGAGYMEDNTVDAGESLTVPSYVGEDLDDVVAPCLTAVETFDKASPGKELALEVTLGYLKPSAAVAAQAAAAAGMLARLKAFLLGTPADPTRNSLYVAEFMGGGAPGIGGLFFRLASKLDRLDRYLSRPQTLPLVGPFIAKAKQLKDMVGTASAGVAQSIAMFESTQAGLLAIHAGVEAKKKRDEIDDLIKEEQSLNTERKTASPDRIKQIDARLKEIADEKTRLDKEATAQEAELKKSPFVREVKQFQKDADTAYYGDQKFLDRAKAAAALGSADVIHAMRPIRNWVRQLRNLTATVGDFIAQVRGFLGWDSPPPSALGLIATHGVSTITPDRVFGYAGDGFHFVSAKANKGPGAQPWLKARLPKGSIADFVLGKSVVRPEPKPGFLVETTGGFEVASEGNVRLSAYGVGANVRARARNLLELSAGSTVAISARGGTAEVTGAAVYIGLPVAIPIEDDARRNLAVLAAPNALGEQTAALQRVYLAKVRELDAMLPRETELRDAHGAAIEEYGRARSLFDFFSARGKVSTTRAAVAAYELLLVPKRAAVVAAQAPYEAALQAQALAATPLVENLDKDVVRDVRGSNETQAPSATVAIAAMREVSLYSPTKITQTSKAVAIEAHDPLTIPPAPPARITANKKVEIEVGDWTVTVEKDGVTIAKVGGAKIKIDDSGILLDAGNTGSVKLRSKTLGQAADAVNVDAKTCSISGNQIQLG